MDTGELLTELFGRVDDHLVEILDGIDARVLNASPGPDANTIAWLVWHLTRVEDHHVSEILGEPQVWLGGDWAARFGLEPDEHDTGYGHSREQVLAVRPDTPDALFGYHSAVATRTRGLLQGVSAADLDRIVDEGWDPPVSLGVRLVSIADDQIQHAGQAAYVRGLLAGTD
jgi:uncharacterized damage-inducible protein DinB